MESIEIPGRGRLSYLQLGTTTNPAVLLLHGMAGSHQEIKHLGEFLARDLHVIIPDLPGGGESYRHVEGAAAISVNARALERLCRVLEIESCYVVGHSRGGLVGLALAELQPELVRRLVTLDTFLNDPTQPNQFLAQFYDSLNDAELERQLQDTLLPLLFAEGDEEGVRRANLARMVDVGAETFRAMGHDFLAYDGVGAAARFSRPALMVVSNSGFNSVTQMAITAPSWAAVDVDASHYMLVESAVVFALVADFLHR